MTYDLHPIFVHFPIALLTLYCFLEFISFGKLRRNRSFVFTKAILATLGGLSLLLARQFGDTAKHMLNNPSLRTLVNTHEQYANYSIFVFGIIGIGYLLALVSLYVDNHPSLARVKSDFAAIFRIQKFITETGFAQMLALAGLILLTITGALGGSIVYGASKDPVTNFVYHLFFK